MPDKPSADERKPHTTGAQPDAQSVNETLRGRHVLLVEDNIISRDIARMLLRKQGLEVSVAADGREALERLADHPVDVVLMDCQMPIMDGYEATRRIREQGFESLPVIAMTADDSEAAKKKCLECGMNEYVVKPFKVAQVLPLLSRWLLGPPADQTSTNVPAAEPEHRPAPFTIPGIDTTSGLARMGGDEALYHRVLNQFILNHGDAARLIRDAIARDDLVEARRHAHSVKGVTSSFGAGALMHIAATLEQELATGHPFTRTPLLETFASTLKENIDAIVRYLNSVEASPLPRTSLSDDKIREQLLTVLPLLDDYDMESEEALGEVLLQCNSPVILRQLNTAMTALRRYDFETAAHLVRRILHPSDEGATTS